MLKSGELRWCKRRVAGAFFIASVVASLSACTTSEHSPVKPTSVPSAETWNCDEWSVRGQKTERCSAVLDNGFTAIVDSPDGGGAPVIIDPGGPTGNLDRASEALATARQNLPTAVLLTLVPPQPEAVQRSCSSAPDDQLVSKCPVKQIADTYLGQYAQAASAALTRAGGGDDYMVVGASFASIRWSWLVAESALPAPRAITVVSPLNPDVQLRKIREGLAQSANQIIDRVLEGCVTAECLTGIESTELCVDEICDPVRKVAARTGQSRELVQEGLMGLAAGTPLHARTLHEAYTEHDNATLSDAIVRGAASLNGRNALGERTTAHIHVLSSVCPFLVTGPEETDGWLSECVFFPKRTLPEPSLAERSVHPTVGCYYSPQPDPMLGEASLHGNFLGNGYESTRTRGGVFGHGDLLLASSMAAEHRRSGYTACPSPPVPWPQH